MGRQGDIAFRSAAGGTLIRHAGCSLPLPVGTLTVPVIELSFKAPLMTEVGGASLLTAALAAAAVTAILLSPVAGAADPEGSAATISPARPLTQNNFACMYHPRSKARLDISCRSWQPKAICLCNLLNAGCWQWALVADTTEASPFSTFRDTLYEDDDGCRTTGADDVEVCSCRDLFRKLRIQMIDNILKNPPTR
jgi:hypothetical protein